VIEFTGREFLSWYSATKPKLASTTGLFDTFALRNAVGGVELLCDAVIGIYCEYLFLVKCALLDRIVYMDVPFYVFRRHAESASESNQDLENHPVAGQELLKKCGEILRDPTLVDDFSSNLLKICTIHIITFAYVTARFEFAQTKFGIGTVYRALSRHRKESLRIMKLFATMGGDIGLRNTFTFIKVNFFCRYIMVRLLAHFFQRSKR
jgi:hypothetical protein